MRMAIASVAAALVVVGAAAPAVATHEPPPPWPEHDRLYLGATDQDHTYWTVDPADPELSRGSLVQRCGLLEGWRFWQQQKPCFAGGLLGGERFYTTFFAPGSVFEDPAEPFATGPFEFHLEMEVEALGSYEVSLVMQSGVGSLESAPAAEVAPGVYEGTLTLPFPLTAADFTYFGVRITTSSERLVTDLKLGGRSWIGLPRTVASKAITDLAAEDTYEEGPTTYSSAMRSYAFNDDDWEVWELEGDTASPRTTEISLDRAPVALIGWVESYDRPFVQDVLRGGQPDTQRLTNGVGISVSRGGEELDHSAGPYLGQGTAGFASTEIGAGPLTVEVSDLDQDEALPFDAHVLAVYGERTLESMRWTVSGDWTLRLPITASCPGAIQAVPQTAEVRSFLVDLDVDTDAAGAPAFTLSYDIPGVGYAPCGEESGGDRIHMTHPGTRTWYFGWTPAQHGTFVSAFDTTFEFEVRYIYSAPPKEHEAE